MVRKYWKKCAVFLMISVLLEILVFNFRALSSWGASNQALDVEKIGDSFYVTGMSGKPGYLYIGVECYTEEGEIAPAAFSLRLRDEGNANYFDLDEVTLYPLSEKNKYLRLHSYGEVQDFFIVPSPNSIAPVWVTDVVYDARVPWFISFPRILAMTFLLCGAWCLRPGSGIYDRKWTKGQKWGAVAALLAANILLLLLLVRSNPVFLNPLWAYHQQYAKLARALSQGEVSIDAGNEEIRAALASLENPFDFEMRAQMVEGYDQVWDTCYYQGNFYVYFGIVPVLLFYLPYYLLFHGDFPTWLGVFLTGAGVLGGVYYLLGKIRRKWFSDSSFLCYLLLSVIMGNGINLFCVMLHADFYYLPIIMALCFSLWGLGLILSAAEDWEKGKRKYLLFKLATGALCLALTAGCRPQFLVGSLLILPVLLPLFVRWKKENTGEMIKCLAAVALPYVITAGGLMYYNFIRFGSVFDFGANYNLTTNDMIHRGMEWGRLPDGIFMYLFQPISISLGFPFVEVTPFYSNYLGATVREWTYGGAIWTHVILLSLAGIIGIRKQLKEKKLYAFTVMSMALAVLVVAVDTQMAGILHRYYTDFLWLLMIPAVIILFQLLENWRGTSFYKWILCFILLAGAWSILYEMGIAIRNSDIMNDNAYRYYWLKAFFQ